MNDCLIKRYITPVDRIVEIKVLASRILKNVNGVKRFRKYSPKAEPIK